MSFSKEVIFRFQRLVFRDRKIYLMILLKFFLERHELTKNHLFSDTWIFLLCVKFVPFHPQKPTNLGRNFTYLEDTGMVDDVPKNPPGRRDSIQPFKSIKKTLRDFWLETCVGPVLVHQGFSGYSWMWAPDPKVPRKMGNPY